MVIRHYAGLWPAEEVRSLVRLNVYLQMGLLIVQSHNANELEN